MVHVAFFSHCTLLALDLLPNVFLSESFHLIAYSDTWCSIGQLSTYRYPKRFP